MLFNRFYEPDVDLETLVAWRELELSSRYEIRLPMMWIVLLRGRIAASLAATRGVEGPEEVVKYLLAGAEAVMTTSALLRRGTQHLRSQYMRLLSEYVPSRLAL